MQQFTLPIFFAGVTAIIVLLSGLIGGVDFFLILKRIVMFGLLVGALGFLIQFLFKKWGIDLNEPSAESQQNNKNTGEFGENQDDGSQDEENGLSQGSKNSSAEPANLNDLDLKETQAEKKETAVDSSFDYTVKDDDEIEFKPLDESLLEKNKTKYIDYQGEKIEYDPKKAAATIRQLLEEDKAHGE